MATQLPPLRTQQDVLGCLIRYARQHPSYTIEQVREGAIDSHNPSFTDPDDCVYIRYRYSHLGGLEYSQVDIATRQEFSCFRRHIV